MDFLAALGFLGRTAVWTDAVAFCLGKGLTKVMLLAEALVLSGAVLVVVLGALTVGLAWALAGAFLAARGVRAFWGTALGAVNRAGAVSALAFV
jgi:hypothetical protein